MKIKSQPSLNPRIWTVIGALASVARTAIDIWRLFHQC